MWHFVEIRVFIKIIMLKLGHDEGSEIIGFHIKLVKFQYKIIHKIRLCKAIWGENMA